MALLLALLVLLLSFILLLDDALYLAVSEQGLKATEHAKVINWEQILGLYWAIGLVLVALSESYLTDLLVNAYIGIKMFEEAILPAFIVIQPKVSGGWLGSTLQADVPLALLAMPSATTDLQIVGTAVIATVQWAIVLINLSHVIEIMASWTFVN